jgi:hypothetical protein
MKKVLLIPLLLVTGCIIAGTYGVLHNQISYTVSPDYFHEFKYHQFGLNPEIPGRIGASIVGWNAAWWMGIVIGIFIVPIGLVIPGAKRYFFGVLRSYAIVAVTAPIVGLTALAVAFQTISPASIGEIVRYGNVISNPVEFARAETMHNFSYLGGLVGIISGIVWIVRERRAALKPAEHGDSEGTPLRGAPDL